MFRSFLAWAALGLACVMTMLVCGSCAPGGEASSRGLTGVAQSALPNAISIENARTDGVVPRTRWDTTALPTLPPIPSILGFSDRFSAAPGETLNFKVKTLGTSSFAYEIYRLGWYGGSGARQVWPTCSAAPCPRLSVSSNPVQPACTRMPNPPNASSPGGTPKPSAPDLPDCINWQTSVSWAIPSAATSGIYVMRLSAIGSPEQEVHHIPFVIREAIAAPRADILYQLGDSTWQAYNGYDDGAGASTGTGASYYNESVGVRLVSYNRPFINRYASGAVHGQFHYLFDLDLPAIRFLERNGYSVGYLGSADLEPYAPQVPLSADNPLSGRRIYLANGHEEYWPGRRFQNLENAQTAGVNMLFMCGNTAYFKTRFEPDSVGNPRRVQVAYKEEGGRYDPLRNGVEWSGLYRDFRPTPLWTRPAAAPAKPANALTGLAPAVVNDVQAENQPAITVPATMTKLRVWKNSVCGLSTIGCSLGQKNVGFEMDIRADRHVEPLVAAQPPGLVSFSATPVRTDAAASGYTTPAFLDATDYSWPLVNVETTFYRKPSGALVAATGSFRWSHGLDDARDGASQPAGVDASMQQATVNLLADMNAQPATLAPGLVAATKSTDVTPPTSQISALNAPSRLLLGTASDANGVVGGVEVSFDSGATWHGAVLSRPSDTTPSTVSWSYIHAQPVGVNPLVRAIDDSGNIEVAHGPAAPIAPSSGVSIYSVGASPPGAQTVVSTVASATDWTLLVPMELDNQPYQLTDFISYNGVTGRTVYSVQAGTCPGASCNQQVRKDVIGLPGWTAAVPIKLNTDTLSDLVSYNALSGRIVLSTQNGYCNVGSCNQTNESDHSPPRLTATTPYALATPGWTSIVPAALNGDALTDLVLYNSATGLAVYAIQQADKTFQATTVVAAAPGWTAIVPMNVNNDGLTDLLSYNAATGLAILSVHPGLASCGGGPSATSCAQTIVNTFLPNATVTSTPGWTTVAPMNLNLDTLTDLVSYNITNGLTVYSTQRGTCPGASCLQDNVNGLWGSPSWTTVVPINLDGTNLTDLLSYK